MEDLYAAGKGAFMEHAALINDPPEERIATQVLSENRLERINDIFTRSFKPVMKNSNIYQSFFALIKKLNKFFSLSKAVLVVHSERDNCLKVIAVRRRKGTRTGLALTIPEKNSLLYKIFRENSIFTLDYPVFGGANFIERKLLFGRRVSSVAVCPLTANGRTTGLICMTSPIDYAFSMFRNGILDGILEEYGQIVDRELNRLPI